MKHTGTWVLATHCECCYSMTLAVSQQLLVSHSQVACAAAEKQNTRASGTRLHNCRVCNNNRCLLVHKSCILIC